MTQAVQAAGVKVTWVGADGAILATHELDLEALDALQQDKIATSTPWTAGLRYFSGPTLAAVAAIENRTPVRALLHALNDFTAEVPSTDWTDLGIVLATRVDGRVPRVFEKGPFWLAYPLDALPQPVEQKYLSRMIWQVDAITFYLE